MNTRVFHTLEPVWQPDSRILLLGSMPSPKSRETGFYYGHPQNRFWKVLPALYGEEALSSIPEKCAFLKRHRLALWDVLASCTIQGASDASIRDARPNDLSLILDHAPIEAIFCTGKQALRLYETLCEPKTGRKAVGLPSTSPANCRMGMETLMAAYAAILRV